MNGTELSAYRRGYLKALGTIAFPVWMVGITINGFVGFLVGRMT